MGIKNRPSVLLKVHMTWNNISQQKLEQIIR